MMSANKLLSDFIKGASSRERGRARELVNERGREGERGGKGREVENV